MKEQENRGGAREGAGRKSGNQFTDLRTRKRADIAEMLIEKVAEAEAESIESGRPTTAIKLLQHIHCADDSVSLRALKIFYDIVMRMMDPVVKDDKPQHASPSQFLPEEQPARGIPPEQQH